MRFPLAELRRWAALGTWSPEPARLYWFRARYGRTWRPELATPRSINATDPHCILRARERPTADGERKLGAQDLWVTEKRLVDTQEDRDRA